MHYHRSQFTRQKKDVWVFLSLRCRHLHVVSMTGKRESTGVLVFQLWSLLSLEVFCLFSIKNAEKENAMHTSWLILKSDLCRHDAPSKIT